mmetsp:Transcript_62642/g.111685  ORF Transcript_62642/g.111685 Transcript_62642/m.111685 type:complete len:215 (+) Transcript_62642:1389-2033(+)
MPGWMVCFWVMSQTTSSSAVPFFSAMAEASASSSFAFSTSRTRARTRCPLASSCSVTRLPTPPVAPVTRTTGSRCPAGRGVPSNRVTGLVCSFSLTGISFFTIPTGAAVMLCPLKNRNCSANCPGDQRRGPCSVAAIDIVSSSWTRRLGWSRRRRARAMAPTRMRGTASRLSSFRSGRAGRLAGAAGADPGVASESKAEGTRAAGPAAHTDGGV